MNLLRKIETKFFVSKTIHPFIFPFAYFASRSIYEIKYFLKISIFKTKTEKNSRKLSKDLYLNGYTLINNFLDENLYLKVKSFLESQPEDFAPIKKLERFDNTSRAHFDLSKYNNDENILGQFIKVLKETSLRSNPRYQAYYEEFFGDDDTQGNEELHIDTFQPTFKMFYYLEDVNAFPFEYVSGSQKTNFDNLRFHFFCQLKNYFNLTLKKNIFYIFGIAMPGGSWRVKNYPYGIAGKEEIKKNLVKFNVKANTLLIANTSGFHRRSDEISNGYKASRKMLFIGERSSLFSSILSLISR